MSSAAASRLEFKETFYDTADKEPWAFFERVREAGDVVWDAGMNAWLIVSYDLARAVLKDNEVFAHPYANMQAGDAYLKLRSNNPRSFHFLSGEQHAAMHRWYFNELLSPKWVAKYRVALVDSVVEETLQKLAGRREVDLFNDFAEWIPLGVFAKLLELPGDPETLLRIRHLNDRIAAFTILANSLKLEGTPSAEDVKTTNDAIAAGQELDELILPVVRKHSSGQGDDFISRLWAGGPSIFPDWNELDTLDACRRLLFAGTDTTTHAIANALYMFMNDAELKSRLVGGDQGAIERFVEEVLRLNGSVQFRPRRVTQDTDLAGVKIKKGEMVIVFLLAANRDPNHYSCPFSVDLDRDKPRDHIAFNYGIRVCLGAALARAELVVAVTELLKRFPAVRFNPDAEPPHCVGLLRRTFRPLNALLV